MWFISPSRKTLPFWLYFASSFPAVLVSVVLFFEVELTRYGTRTPAAPRHASVLLSLRSIMIQSKLRCVHSSKVIKGTGYHLDILIAGRAIVSTLSRFEPFVVARLAHLDQWPVRPSLDLCCARAKHRSRR